MRHYEDHRDMSNTEDAFIPPIWNNDSFREHFEGGGNQIGYSDDPEWSIWCDTCMERHGSELRYEDHAYCDDCEADLGEADRVKPPNRGDVDRDLYAWLCDKCLAEQVAADAEAGLAVEEGVEVSPDRRRVEGGDDAL